jgi:FkbM family methyltransferase
MSMRSTYDPFWITKKVMAPFESSPVLRRWLRSVFRRYHRVTGRRYHVSHLCDLNLLIDLSNLIDENLAIWGRYEEKQIRYFLNLSAGQPITEFYDIGSFAALYSLRFLQAFPDIEIHAFEPHPHNRNQLHANLFLNGSPQQITVHQFALSDREMTVRIWTENDRNRGKSVISNSEGPSVESKVFDQMFSSVGRSAALKIDVEGHELEVITGMKTFLENNVCILQIESFDDNARLLCRLMDKLGYTQINQIDNDHYFTRSRK